MPLGVSEEHAALHDSVRRWTETHCPPSVPRALLDAEREELPGFWASLVEQGWLGLHVAEADGGQGFGLTELVVVLEELGRVVAPGPFLPTVLASAAIAAGRRKDVGAAHLPGLCDGSTIGAVALPPATITAEPAGAEAVRLSGRARPVLGAAQARLFVLPVTSPDGERWYVVDAGDVTVEPLPSLDPTRRVGEVVVEGVTLGAERQLPDLTGRLVADLAAIVMSAECAGGADWCVDTAASHAKVREQFGRPIGQFQAVKHRCADMLVAAGQAAAVAWDAARGADDREEASLAAAVAGVLAPEAFFTCAKDCVQVLGGIGFTWEHDVHVYLKRAASVRALLGGPEPWRARVASLALAGVRRTLDVALPEEAEPIRVEVRALAESLGGHDPAEVRRRLADEGYMAPHWPRPWGRGAGAVEQLVVDEELQRARVRRPQLAVGAWALPTIIAHGTPEQQERWVGPTLHGEMTWCQMFSEPGAGSDLASLTTKATRVDGGWLLTGQKVWTSIAQRADWAICLARTDPDAPRHEGITYFLVDMRSAGIDVRPLREMTGQAMFNEVFLSDVFVPDDCVVGPVNGGWRLARTTLANERVSMGSGSSFGLGVESLIQLVSARAAEHPMTLDRLGGLLAEAECLAVLGFRLTLRALTGAEPGPESSVRKLVGVEHDQRVQETWMTLLGSEGATVEGDAAPWTGGFLANRCLTIAGGTSEIQRNVIAERLLGLPRDP
jgi:alkylation response protein AidB-like acyl-CoA dehydrogenase